MTAQHTRQLLERTTGEGWLLEGRRRLAEVSYDVSVWRTAADEEVSVALWGLEGDTRLLADVRLTLQLRDGRSIEGDLDGTVFRPSGPLRKPAAVGTAHSQEDDPDE